MPGGLDRAERRDIMEGWHLVFTLLAVGGMGLAVAIELHRQRKEGHRA